MSRAKISVVVPFYNTEKYLVQCLRSLQLQTYPYFEAICVDDGSTDYSKEIVRQFTMCDERFILIEMGHCNAGEARNVGISNATGEYIIFLDSDDFFEQTLLEKALNSIICTDASFCIFGVDNYHDNCGIFDDTYKLDLSFWENKQVIDVRQNHLNIEKISRGVPWDRLYKMDFIKSNKLTFQSIVRCNDTAFCTCAIFLADQISIVDDILLHHRINHGNNLQSGINESPMIYYQTAMYTFESMLKSARFGENLFNIVDFVIRRIDVNFNRFAHHRVKEELRDILSCDKRFCKEFIDTIVRLCDEMCSDESYSLSNVLQIYERLNTIAYWQLSDEIIAKIRVAQGSLMKNAIFLYKQILSSTSLADSEATVGLYGRGLHTHNLLFFFKLLVGDVKANIIFIDSSYEGEWDGRDCIAYTDISSYKFDRIIVSSFRYRKEMVENILGVDDNASILNFYDFEYYDLFSSEFCECDLKRELLVRQR